MEASLELGSGKGRELWAQGGNDARRAPKIAANGNNPARMGNATVIKERMDIAMIEQDTVRLLRECDAGVKMGISSIEDVLGRVRSPELETLLTDCKREHEKLSAEIQKLLNQYRDEGKEPPAIAAVMSELMTKWKLAVNESDETVTDLMTDGCDMGVKSLSRYLNQYRAADEVSKDIAKRLIKQEADLAVSIRPFL